MTTFNISDPARPTIDKDVNALLDYSWDWSAWLGTDTIQSQVVTVEAGLTMNSSSFSGAKVTAFISGGGTNLGATKRATCKITTTGGRVEERSIYLKIVQR